ncbi:hypothetical protein ABIB25_005847 [Nakamurella sp. UYEF19]|uniref:hypothetical protein n=1 Tax=Nakamurella sp. UYEF19 TaxID=1756392 RepID=UPI003399140A
MSELREHPAATGAEMAEETRHRRRRSARIRRTRRLIAVTVGVVLLAAWLLHLKDADAYRVRVTRDVVGVNWVLDAVSSGNQIAKVPQAQPFSLQLNGGGSAATTDSGGCGLDSATWTATSDGFDFSGDGYGSGLACGPNGVPPVIDPLIVSAQEELLSGASVTDRIDGTRLILTYSSYTLTYHRSG